MKRINTILLIASIIYGSIYGLDYFLISQKVDTIYLEKAERLDKRQSFFNDILTLGDNTARLNRILSEKSMNKWISDASIEFGKYNTTVYSDLPQKYIAHISKEDSINYMFTFHCPTGYKPFSRAAIRQDKLDQTYYFGNGDFIDRCEEHRIFINENLLRFDGDLKSAIVAKKDSVTFRMEKYTLNYLENKLDTFTITRVHHFQ